MESIKALSRGTTLVLVAGPLLFFSLFFTWQNLAVDFGPAGRADYPLDGWDVWGLLIALQVIALVTLMVIVHMTELEMSEDIPWDTVTFALGNAVFVLTVVKNVTDADSTWTSYGFVGLATAVATGAYLNWAETRSHERPLLGRGDRGFSSTA